MKDKNDEMISEEDVQESDEMELDSLDTDDDDDDSDDDRNDIAVQEEAAEEYEVAVRKAREAHQNDFHERDLDATRLYLGEIGFSPLLTAEQEVEIARKIQKGDQEARKRMIESNLRLVKESISVIIQYYLVTVCVLCFWASRTDFPVRFLR